MDWVLRRSFLFDPPISIDPVVPGPVVDEDVVLDELFLFSGDLKDDPPLEDEEDSKLAPFEEEEFGVKGDD